MATVITTTTTQKRLTMRKIATEQRKMFANFK